MACNDLNSFTISSFGCSFKTNFPISLPLPIRSALISMLLCLIFLLAQSSPVRAQDSLLTYNHPDRPPTMEELLTWKEVFIYEVQYGFLNLATIQTTIVRDTLHRGQQVWWLQTVIKSNPDIPFIRREENEYNTFFVATDSLPYTQVYWRDNMDENEYNEERYFFDYDRQKVYVSERGQPVDTLEITQPANSGHLTFYYSRLFAGTGKEYRYPVYINQEKGYITGQNSSESKRRQYWAFAQPIETYSSNGQVDVNGPFGFTGNYKAWHSADDLRIPVEAHVKVWLGSVKVKIVNYQKVRR